MLPVVGAADIDAASSECSLSLSRSVTVASGQSDFQIGFTGEIMVPRSQAMAESRDRSGTSSDTVNDLIHWHGGIVKLLIPIEELLFLCYLYIFQYIRRNISNLI